ncbi:circadian clock protein KaiB [Microcoleus sp. FACHB-1515]|uniref:circadian clock KaiB family protein n=1 Tax=Leptolyngbya sp. FACHB-1515 TaxID=2933931 RepID=UPI001688FBB9|nr:circadian clock KaiB family protein [Microcoleus sp. FACHB-1515]MBD2089415.1 circadian clock protein KaiB [Microcoleus sp. FACHB-1515]
MRTGSPSNPLPQVFKGIALFTPGGDLVYCIDEQKQSRWHLHLCAALQEALGLSEPPHFLVPCYSATIDRWLDPHTQQLQTVAEACPFVLKYQSLLNALFGTDVVWQAIDRAKELCDPDLLIAYRQQFPQLWQDHDLVLRYEQSIVAPRNGIDPPQAVAIEPAAPQGYVFRLFVSGQSAATEQTLQHLHQMLENLLRQPYTLQLVDVHKHPDQAERDQVTATPTLLRAWPHPVRRIVGEFEDAHRILQILAAADGREA